MLETFGKEKIGPKLFGGSPEGGGVLANRGEIQGGQERA